MCIDEQILRIAQQFLRTKFLDSVTFEMITWIKRRTLLFPFTQLSCIVRMILPHDERVGEMNRVNYRSVELIAVQILTIGREGNLMIDDEQRCFLPRVTLLLM